MPIALPYMALSIKGIGSVLWNLKECLIYQPAVGSEMLQLILPVELTEGVWLYRSLLGKMANWVLKWTAFCWHSHASSCLTIPLLVYYWQQNCTLWNLTHCTSVFYCTKTQHGTEYNTPMNSTPVQSIHNHDMSVRPCRIQGVTWYQLAGSSGPSL